MKELKIVLKQDVLGKEFKIYGDYENPLFLAKDVATWIEHSDVSTMIRNVDENEKVTNIVCTLGGNQEAWFLTEDGLYEVLMQSRKPIAKQFKKRVKEILKSVRKHGGYLTPQKLEEALLNPDVLIRLATELKTEREKRMELEEKVEQDKPKVLFADAVSASDDCILVGELAKILKQNGVKTGQNRLFSWLRKHGYLIRRMGSDYNMPTQRSAEMNLFQIKKRIIGNLDGTVRTTKTVVVTGIGQQYFINKFLGKDRFSLLTDWDDFDVTDCEMKSAR